MTTFILFIDKPGFILGPPVGLDLLAEVFGAFVEAMSQLFHTKPFDQLDKPGFVKGVFSDGDGVSLLVAALQ